MMSQKLLQAVAKTTRLRVVNLLKKSQGLTVPEIAAGLGMSYMGTRDVCNDLLRRGIIDARRQPKAPGTTGRPSRLLRLTEKAHELFPLASNPLTLDLLVAAKKLHGAAEPERLLMLVWQQKASVLSALVKGADVRERAKSLAALRDEEGHMAVFEEGVGLRIVERHCPFLDVLRAYPVVARLEAELMQRVLGVPVRREESIASGLLRVDFLIG